jgi:hypothetical protein
VDSLTSPILGNEFSQQLAFAERESGYRIRRIPYSFRENDRVALERLLSEGTYPYVVMSPYVAIELETLVVRFPSITFLCMDAPEGFSPHPNVRGISFDPVPALQTAMKRWEQYRTSRVLKDRRLFILAKEELALFQELSFGEPSPEVRIVLIPKGEAEETTRKNLRKELAEPADLLVIWAGRSGSYALEILSEMENRKRMGVIGVDIHRFPRIQEAPFMVSLEKDYIGALSQMLGNKGSIPYRIPYRIFPP